jgi:demethylmenaquinone methyltransferase/2-methoxy-6-polyprenyl-1,4-benzoquinol methylase
MFSSIAPRYDLLNRLLSLGTDRRWRREAVAWTEPETGGFHLDVATGTADVALEIFRQKGNGAFVAGVDISVSMMRALPFRDNVFDSASIAFGIRNVVHRELGLREMCRVVKPGGRVVVLEFSQPDTALFGALYRFYFTKVLPRLGGLLSRRSAYVYLPDSVQEFPPPRDFAKSMRDAGCDPVTFRPLTRGIVTLYVGVKRH